MNSKPSQTFIIYQGRIPSPTPSAAERRVQDLASGLAQFGHSVTIIAPKHYNDREHSFLPGNIEAQFLGISSARPSLRSRMAFWSALRAKINSDAPQCSIFYNTTLDSLLAFRTKSPCAYELCDLNSVSNHAPPRKVMFWITERMLPRFSKLNVAISSGIESHLKRWAPKTPVVRIPGLADQQLFKSHSLGAKFRADRKLPKGLVIVGYSGTFFKQKGLETLLKAFKLAKGRLVEPTKLFISGSGANSVHEDNPTKLVDELGISDDVVFTGNLPPTEHVQYLSTIDIAVCPSMECAFSNLSFPTKIAEYAAMAKAIVATRTGDIPQYFNHNESALLVPPSDPQSMSNAIVELVADRNRRNALGSAALDVAKRSFSSVSAGEKLSLAIRTLFGTSKPNSR